jgi:hypothetical protein
MFPLVNERRTFGGYGVILMPPHDLWQGESHLTGIAGESIGGKGWSLKLWTGKFCSPGGERFR